MQGAFFMPQKRYWSMEHKHGVFDSDTLFSINSTTRQVKADPSHKTTLMQNDHNSERFTFELPRYIEQHDMAECNQVEIHYLNSSSRDKDSGILSRLFRDCSSKWSSVYGLAVPKVRKSIFFYGRND